MIEDLISKWQKEMDISHDKAVSEDASNDDHWYYSARYDTISDILEDIKTLNGETVKLRESCPHSESVMLIRAFVCKKCGTILDKLEAD